MSSKRRINIISAIIAVRKKVSKANDEKHVYTLEERFDVERDIEDKKVVSVTVAYEGKLWYRGPNQDRMGDRLGKLISDKDIKALRENMGPNGSAYREGDTINLEIKGSQREVQPVIKKIREAYGSPWRESYSR